MRRIKIYVFLHILLMVYSLSGICSKMAATQESLSPRFFFFYGLILLLLMIYAICWQQIIKRIPLITAYANKAVTVVWGMVWGFLFFHEAITTGKIMGMMFIVMGIILFAYADGETNHE